MEDEQRRKGIKETKTTRGGKGQVEERGAKGRRQRRNMKTMEEKRFSFLFVNTQTKHEKKPLRSSE